MKRPLSITVISWLFIAVGSVALLYHLSEFKAERPVYSELVLVCFIRLLAIVGGAAMLRARNWGRWLLAVWMAYHIVLSLFHSPVELMMHILLFGIIGYFLFRPQASAHFHRDRSELLQVSDENNSAAPK